MLGWDSMRFTWILQSRGIFPSPAAYLVEDASERKFDILIIERMSDFTNCCMDAQKVLRAMKKQGVRIFYWNEHMLELDEYTDEPTSQLQTHLIIENIARQEELRKMKNILRWQFSSHEATQ